jgi:hypothetical protein
MLAHHRTDVAELNEGARALLRRAGRLGEQELLAGEREFRAGDRVICRRNDAALGVCNGTRATVHAVDPASGIVTLQLDGGPIRRLPTRDAAEQLEYGYALTGHASQGLTIDRAFVLVRAEGALAEWGYVVTSRARSETRLYAVGPELRDDAGVGRDEPRAATRKLAGALTRVAAEPPAAERHAETHDGPGPRQVERARLEREIESRVRLLASARGQLDDLGWIGRRRHGPALHGVIDAQLRVLADLRTELRELPTHDASARPARLEPPVIARTREPVVRQAPERGIGMER